MVGGRKSTLFMKQWRDLHCLAWISGCFSSSTSVNLGKEQNRQNLLNISVPRAHLGALTESHERTYPSKRKSRLKNQLRIAKVNSWLKRRKAVSCVALCAAPLKNPFWKKKNNNFQSASSLPLRSISELVLSVWTFSLWFKVATSQEAQLREMLLGHSSCGIHLRRL